MKQRILFLIFILDSLVLTLAEFAPELPVETFFKTFEFSQMKLSPDGNNLAGLAFDKGEIHLVLVDLQKPTPKAVMYGDISDFVWVDNDRLILQMGGIGLGGLLAINKDGSQKKILVRPLLFQVPRANVLFQVAEVLHVFEPPNGEILMEQAEINPFVRPAFPHTEVRRINVFTGKSVVEVRNLGRVIHWLADHCGVVRTAMTVEKNRVKLLYRHDSASKWDILAEFDLLDDGIWPLEFAPDNKNLLVRASKGAETDGLYLFDVENRALGERTWWNDRFDFGHLIVLGERPLGVYFDA